MSFLVGAHYIWGESISLTWAVRPLVMWAHLPPRPHLLPSVLPPVLQQLCSFLLTFSCQAVFSNWVFAPFLFLMYFMPGSEINQLIDWWIMEMVRKCPCLPCFIPNIYKVPVDLYTFHNWEPTLPANLPRTRAFYRLLGLSLKTSTTPFETSPHLCTIMLRLSPLTKLPVPGVEIILNRECFDENMHFTHPPPLYQSHLQRNKFKLRQQN